MVYKLFISSAILIISLLPACNTENDKTADNLEKKQFVEEKNPVKVIILKRQDFKKELLSNGKLKACKKSILKFETSGILKKLYVKNGQYVAAGSKIAQLDNKTEQQNLDNALIQAEKAKLTLQELLIGQGYEQKNMEKIPENILKIANIRSGYAEALNNLKIARQKLDTRLLKAPFGGKIANLQLQEYDYIDAGKDFCSLIDDSSFQVFFEILESELSDVHIGQKLSIIPFSKEFSYKGSITEINPVIEKNGTIKIKAQIYNKANQLLEGMNVKVLIKSLIKNQLVVPKSAVLLRQNKEVLFRYKSGLAFWTYVKTGYENSTSYTIRANKERGAEISEGDTVIISGNLNLAHESKVEIQK